MGVKHRQHPVYGFDAMVLILLGIKDNGGTLEDAFGIDDNKWFDPNMENDTSTGWDSQQLYEVDPKTGELRPIEGDRALFGMVVESIGDMIGCGEMRMVEDIYSIQTESILSITFLVC